MNPGMALEKELDRFTFMPFCAVNVEMNGIARECSEHVLEDEQESFPIALSGAYDSFPSQEGRHPTGQVEPFPVLAGSRNFEAFTFPGPSSPEAGMETEAGFILKDDRFIGFKLGEFFLTPPENRRHPWFEPADRHSQPASGCSPSDVTSTGPDAPSIAPQTFSSGESPVSLHPRRLAIGRSPGASSPNLAPAALSARMSVDPYAPAAAWVPGPLPRLDLHHLLNVPESRGSDQVKRLLAQDVGPPKPAA